MGRERRREGRRKLIRKALRKKKVTISGYKTPSKPSANKRLGTNDTGTQTENNRRMDWTRAHTRTESHVRGKEELN